MATVTQDKRPEGRAKIDARAAMEALNAEAGPLNIWLRTQANAPAQRPWFRDTGIEAAGQLAGGSGEVAAGLIRSVRPVARGDGHAAETERRLGWEPVPQLMAEIHDGDPLLRADWPLSWWGLEPLDRRRHDWQIRYASVFRVRHALPRTG